MSCLPSPAVDAASGLTQSRLRLIGTPAAVSAGVSCAQSYWVYTPAPTRAGRGQRLPLGQGPRERKSTMARDRAQAELEDAPASRTRHPAPPVGLREEDAAASASASPALPVALAQPPRAGRGFDPLRAVSVLGLQQTLGNQAVQRLLQRAASPSASTSAS